MNDDLKNATEAYRRAVEEARRHGGEAFDAFQKMEMYSSEEARKIFKKRAEREIIASENWRKAAERMLEVIAEIEQRG